MDSLQFSPSELIYLFLDGEHNGVERSVLFRAMADNQELQHEFEDALKIRTAALNEAQSINPPAALTHSLMSRAGFTAAGAAVGSAGTGWLAGIFSHWGAVALMVLLPTLAGSAGYYIGRQSSDTPIQASAAQQSSSSNSANALPAAESTELNQLRQQLISEERKIALLTEQNRIARRPSAPSFAREHTTDQSGTSSSGTSSTGFKDGESSTVLTNTGNAVASNNDSRSSTLGTSLKLVNAVHATPIVQLQQYNVPIPELSNAASSMAVASIVPSPRMIVGIRGLRSLMQTQDSLVNPADAHSIGNFSASVRYVSSEHIQYVLEAGRENYPTYVYETSPTGIIRRVQQNMLWLTVGARYSTSPIEALFGTRMFMQGSVGISEFGAIFRPMLGVEWQPDSRVSFHAGLEQVVLRTSYQGIVNLNMKTAMSYGVSLNF